MNTSDYKINRERLTNLLASLFEDSVPLWGKMTSRQMVEHLIEEVKWANGKITCTCEIPKEVTEVVKQLMIYSDILPPRNYRTGDLPASYCYSSLEEAVGQLFTELSAFDDFFKIPGGIAIHPIFGSMDHTEWTIWQNKHFLHHFTQFGLVPVTSRWGLSEVSPYVQNELIEY